MILPYLDQAPMYNLLQPGTLSLAANLAAGGAQATAAQTPLSGFMCPSDTGPGLNDFDQSLATNAAQTTAFGTYNRKATSNGTDRIAIAKSNYVGISDTSVSGTPAWSILYGLYLGTMGANSKVGIRDITDGTSNTLLLGERAFRNKGVAIGAGNALGFGMTSNSGSYVGSYARTALAIHGIPYYGINQFGPAPEHNTRSFSSTHVGGAHFLMADGAVRFISDSIDYRYLDIAPTALPGGSGDHSGSTYNFSVFQFLITRAGGDIVGEF